MIPQVFNPENSSSSVKLTGLIPELAPTFALSLLNRGPKIPSTLLRNIEVGVDIVQQPAINQQTLVESDNLTIKSAQFPLKKEEVVVNRSFEARILNWQEGWESSSSVPLPGSTSTLFNPKTNNLPTPTFSKMYVFGDSLSDPGNLFQTTTFVQPFQRLFGLNIPVMPKSPLYFEGRFSNGPVWVENLAKNLGLSLTPSTELSVLNPFLPIPFPVTVDFNGLKVSPFFNGATTTQGVNFAFGSAKTGQNGSGEFGDFIPGVLQQVEWFANDHKQAQRSADPNGLYVIWAGANDYLGDPNPQPANTVNNLSRSIESLFNLGARNFLVPNLPDLGRTPLAGTLPPVAAASLSNLTDQHNLLLNNTLNALSGSLNGINLIPLDVNSLFDRTILTPQEFGLKNVSQAFLDPLNPPSIGSNPNDYLFWDPIHPTASVHGILANFALDTLTSHQNQPVMI